MRVFLIIGLLICVFSCGTKKDDLREKHFDSLDLAEREIMQFDSVDGEYLKWKGTNKDSVTWALYFDKPNRFAIKSFFADKADFFTKVPGNINASGQWTEKDDRLILKFYFAPADWSMYFDSVDNKVIRVIDKETIEIDKRAESIWIVKTECKKMTD